MAQEYEVLQFKAGNFQDNFGNTWCDMALKGVGEPVRIVVKDPTAIHEGDILYGEIKEMTSKANKPYNRFYREQRPEGEDHHVSTTSNPGGNANNAQPVKEDDTYWEDKNSAIRAQWAINAALQYSAQLPAPATGELLEKKAVMFYAMVDRVKDSNRGTEEPTDEDWKNLSDALDKGVPIEM